MKYIKSFLIVLFLLTANIIYSQDEIATLSITLKNNGGKPHRGVVVSLTETHSNIIYRATSNSNGEVSFELPFDGDFDIMFSNSQIRRHMKMPGQPGVRLKSTYTYNGGNDDWSKRFPPSATQKRQWEHLFNQYADTVNLERDTRIANYNERFQEFSIKLTDLSSGYLANEMVYLRAKKHKFHRTKHRCHRAVFS